MCHKYCGSTTLPQGQHESDVFGINRFISLLLGSSYLEGDLFRLQVVVAGVGSFLDRILPDYYQFGTNVGPAMIKFGQNFSWGITGYG